MTAKGGEKTLNDNLDYQQAKQLAQHSDPGVRASLARRDDIRPELLYYLAADREPAVRRAIAVNRATPGQADLLLARDPVVEVRADLAAKIARLFPDFAADEREHISQATYEALDILARDQVVRVRQIIAETLKTVADAPPEIIQRLARDAELAVAAPLLEFSPMLTDADLVDIIRKGVAPGGLSAIGRRAGLREQVADTVAASKDSAAIAALLGNASAQVREETLDRLIDRAPMVEAWHDPLCRRPALPPGAAVRLARFVADRLLGVLQARRDLDEGALAAVGEEVRRRLDEDGAATDDGKAGEAAADDTPAQQLFAAGKLTAEDVGRAVQAGRRGFVIDALALLADVPAALVDKVLSTRSAKGVLAISWKAKLPVRTAVEIQRRLARIRPDGILNARREGEYPLDPAEMTWQLEFFADLNREGRGR